MFFSYLYLLLHFNKYKQIKKKISQFILYTFYEKINHIKIFYSETEMIFSWPTFKIMYLNVTPTLHPKWMELNGKNEIELGKTFLKKFRIQIKNQVGEKWNIILYFFFLWTIQEINLQPSAVSRNKKTRFSSCLFSFKIYT